MSTPDKDTEKTTKPEASETTSEAPKVESPSEDKSLTPVLSKTVKLSVSKKEVEIHKLKAGPYYVAQQLFTDWLQSVHEILEVSKLNEKDIVGDDGKPNISKTNKSITDKIGDEEASEIRKASEKSLKIRVAFLSACMEMTPEKFATAFYPEEVDQLGQELIQINRFMDNLKKSVAPTGQK